MLKLLPWIDLPVVTQETKESRLTLREASPFLGRSHSVIADDCRFLEIRVYPNKGGFLTRQDMWELSVLAFWKKWTHQASANWRGDRSDIWKQFNNESQLLSFVASKGLTRSRFDERFDLYLDEIGKGPSQQFRSLAYAA